MKVEYHSSTIQRALDILNLFKDQPSLSLTEIQKTLGFNKATLYRVLSTLHDNGYLKKDERGRYELGLNIFILGHRISKEYQLINVATPFMKDLSQSFGLTAHLGILDGTNVIVIQKSEPNRLIKMSCQVGGSLPAHCTSQGKTLLAFSSKETVQKVIDAHGLQRYTPHTICTTEGLMAELEAVRVRGYAIDNAEHEKNIRCLGVPIFNESGKIEAALSAAGTVIDIPDEESIQKSIDRLKEARDKIKMEMGYLNTLAPRVQR
ncbi:MAG: IclR family transcriptional regulator [Thermodesulfobacteriota bacterium]|jgi:DNA-binding IclR family transcriptional regulator